MHLGEKIAYLRKQRGWSQEDLAYRMQVSRQSVSKWESLASLPDIDKVVMLSRIFEVSTDYLLLEEMEKSKEEEKAEENIEEETEDGEEEPDSPFTYILYEEDAQYYLTDMKKHAKKIATGVGLCVCSPAPLLLLESLALGGVAGWQEDSAGALGMVILFAVVALGVGNFITSGIRMEQYKMIEEKDFSLNSGVEGYIREQKQLYQPAFATRIAAGVILCIFSPAFLFMAEAFGLGEAGGAFGVGVLLVLVAMGTRMLVAAGIVQGSYGDLLKEN